MRLFVALLLSFPLTALTSAQHAEASSATQACAAFTPQGKAIEVTVTSPEITLVLGDLAGEMRNFHLPLPGSHPKPARVSSARDGCKIVLDQGGDQAAIVVPYAVTVVDGKIVGQSVAVARFDLSIRSWHAPIVLDPSGEDAGRYLKTSTVAGYLLDTRNLVVARSNGHLELLNENDEVIPGSDSFRPLESPSDGFFSGVDATGNRRWSTCPYQEAFHRLEPCALTSVSLVGEQESGPEVKATNHGVAQWQGPRFYLFPNSSTLVFGGSSGKLFSRNETLWVANLADGSIRERGFPGHLHDDDLSGRAAVSPDGKVFAFGINMSALTPPYLLDNYSSRGERLLLVDGESLKTIADIEPPHNESPFGIAVDHRDGKTTLLVNWGAHWERKQFPDK